MTLNGGPDFMPDLRPTHADLLYAHGLLFRHLIVELHGLCEQRSDFPTHQDQPGNSESCLNSLPQELLENICSRLEPGSLSSLSCCSRSLLLRVSHDFLWKLLACRECALLSLDLPTILQRSLQWKRAALYLFRHRIVYQRALELTSSLQAVLCNNIPAPTQASVSFLSQSSELNRLFRSLGLPSPFRVRVGRASLFRDIASLQRTGCHFTLALMPPDSSLFVAVQLQMSLQAGFYAPFSPLRMTILFDRAYPNVTSAEVAVINGVWSPLADPRTGLLRIDIPTSVASISPLSFVLETLLDAFTNPLILTRTCHV